MSSQRKRMWSPNQSHRLPASSPQAHSLRRGHLSRPFPPPGSSPTPNLCQNASPQPALSKQPLLSSCGGSSFISTALTRRPFSSRFCPQLPVLPPAPPSLQLCRSHCQLTFCPSLLPLGRPLKAPLPSLPPCPAPSMILFPFLPLLVSGLGLLDKIQDGSQI